APVEGLRTRILSLSLASARKLVTYRLPSGPNTRPSGRCRSWSWPGAFVSLLAATTAYAPLDGSKRRPWRTLRVSTLWAERDSWRSGPKTNQRGLTWPRDLEGARLPRNLPLWTSYSSIWPLGLLSTLGFTSPRSATYRTPPLITMPRGANGA